MDILPLNLPPPLLLSEELNGTFHYIKSISDRKMYSTAYKAITITEKWNYIKCLTHYSEPESNIIYNKIEDLGYQGHSGCSFICTLREMQFIAIYGEKKFKEKYDDYEKRASTNSQIQERRRIIMALQLQTE